MSEITQELVKSLFSYDPLSGEFVRIGSGKLGPRGGRGSGWINAYGYISLSIKNKQIHAHRVAWLYVYGYFPSCHIDHINGCRADNRIANLRLATHFQNIQNSKVSKRNKTGLKGVHFVKKKGKYCSQITANRKRISLGLFDTAEEAYKAYKKAAVDLHGEFARLS